MFLASPVGLFSLAGMLHVELLPGILPQHAGQTTIARPPFRTCPPVTTPLKKPCTVASCPSCIITFLYLHLTSCLFFTHFNLTARHVHFRCTSLTALCLIRRNRYHQQQIARCLLPVRSEALHYPRIVSDNSPSNDPSCSASQSATSDGRLIPSHYQDGVLILQRGRCPLPRWEEDWGGLLWRNFRRHQPPK